jgi:hypothetical protein
MRASSTPVAETLFFSVFQSFIIDFNFFSFFVVLKTLKINSACMALNAIYVKKKEKKNFFVNLKKKKCLKKSNEKTIS